MKQLVLAIDQSTSATKAVLFDHQGKLVAKVAVPHRQYVNEKGWVEHDPEEIYHNLHRAVHDVLEHAGIDGKEIVAAGLSNQRETTVLWDVRTGEPVYPAIVWQCGRAQEICNRLQSQSTYVKHASGLNLSPYFSAAKMNWIVEHIPQAAALQRQGVLVASTIDAWLVYRLSGGKCVKTEPANASRTQLMNIKDQRWDDGLIHLFGLDGCIFPEICESDFCFCMTDFEKALPVSVPLHCVLGDSQSALFAQGCLQPGMVKVTYGTGSSVMMNTGVACIASEDLVTSVGWRMHDQFCYVLEGNINYSAATIQWLKEDLRLIQSASEVSSTAEQATGNRDVFFVPAFSGLSAPYWCPSAKALICGMDRSTRKEEVVRAAEESIGYQIQDILALMERDSRLPITSLRVDGGPTRDAFLMQFESDVSQKEVWVPDLEELSAQGVAYGAGLGVGWYQAVDCFRHDYKAIFKPRMTEEERKMRCGKWKKAVRLAMYYSTLEKEEI